MNVYGQLVRAQLEVVTSSPTDIAGRISFDKTAGQVKVSDGTLTRALLRNDLKAILGNSATVAENTRLHRGAVALLQLLLADDATAEGTLSTSIAQLDGRAPNFTDGSKPAAGNIGRVIYNTTFSVLNVDNGSSWIPLTSGAGGGGGANWHADSDAPVETTENGEKIWLFDPSAAQKLTLWVRIPDAYIAGQQVKVLIGHYSPSTSNTILLGAVSTLIQKNVDAVTSTTNQRTSTNSALTNTVADQYRTAELDVSDSTGNVNAVAIAAGDLLKVELTRGSDTDTADIRFVPSATEVKIG